MQRSNWIAGAALSLLAGVIHSPIACAEQQVFTFTGTYQIANSPAVIANGGGPYTARDAPLQIWAPSKETVPTVRGVISVLPGSNSVAWYQSALKMYRETANAMGFAVLGHDTTSMVSTDSTPDDLANNLQSVLSVAGSVSGRPELANAPWIAMGNSLGAFQTSRYAAQLGDRLIAGVAHRGSDNLSASTGAPPPSIFLGTGGGFDTNITRPPIMWQNFKEQRAATRDAPSALAVDWGGPHSLAPTPSPPMALGFVWAQESVKVRYPDGQLPSTTPGDVLELIDTNLTQGWLADGPEFEHEGSPSTYPLNYGAGGYVPSSANEFLDIAPYGEYAGDKTQASWAPTKAAAMAFQAVSSWDGQTYPGNTWPATYNPVKIENVEQLQAINIMDKVRLVVNPTTFDDNFAITKVEYFADGQLIGTQLAGAAAWELIDRPTEAGIRSYTIVTTNAEGRQRASFLAVAVQPDSQWAPTVIDAFSDGNVLNNGTDTGLWRRRWSGVPPSGSGGATSSATESGGRLMLTARDGNGSDSPALSLRSSGNEQQRFNPFRQADYAGPLKMSVRGLIFNSDNTDTGLARFGFQSHDTDDWVVDSDSNPSGGFSLGSNVVPSGATLLLATDALAMTIDPRNHFWLGYKLDDTARLAPETTTNLLGGSDGLDAGGTITGFDLLLDSDSFTLTLMLDGGGESVYSGLHGIDIAKWGTAGKSAVEIMVSRTGADAGRQFGFSIDEFGITRMAAIPEPQTTTLLLAFGMAGLLRRRVR